jgi:hypothetical protein
MTESVGTISPAGDRLPPIREAAKIAWSDLVRVFAALTNVWPIPLAISFALSPVPALLMAGSGRYSLVGELVSLLIGAVTAFFLTPYIIAVHRFIVLDEVAPSYTLRPGEPRFQKFFGWSLLLFAGAGIFAVVQRAPFLLPSSAGVLVISFVSIVVINGLGILLVWAVLRLSILFPAIAVDAPGANWQEVAADTRDCAWQIFLICLLASLPIIGLMVVVWMFFGRGTVGEEAISGVRTFVETTLLVVIASRLYQSLGKRVTQAPAV